MNLVDTCDHLWVNLYFWSCSTLDEHDRYDDELERVAHEWNGGEAFRNVGSKQKRADASSAACYDFFLGALKGKAQPQKK